MFHEIAKMHFFQILPLPPCFTWMLLHFLRPKVEQQRPRTLQESCSLLLASPWWQRRWSHRQYGAPGLALSTLAQPSQWQGWGFSGLEEDQDSGRDLRACWQQQGLCGDLTRMYYAWWMMYDGWFMMHDAWCMMDDAWCMRDDAWWMMHDAWCMMQDAWCMMHDAWWEVNQAIISLVV